MTILTRLAFAALLAFAAVPAQAGNIIEDWDSVKAPKKPALKSISVSAKDTAVISMDLQTSSCVPERRPRCVATLGPIKDLLARARAKGMFVAHTFTSRATVKQILPVVAPLKGELAVSSRTDKFASDELTQALKSRGITNVIIVGTSAEGAVMGALFGGAARGFKMIVPVDGMSSGNPYNEQYVAHSVVNSPSTRDTGTLTKIDMIEIK